MGYLGIDSPSQAFYLAAVYNACGCPDAFFYGGLGPSDMSMDAN